MIAVTDTESDPPASRFKPIWQPSERALETAHTVVTETDIPIHIARYVTVKAEKKQQPDSAEWLRWVLEDEKKAKAELRRHDAEASRRRSWYHVAD